jgi:hypothetical protein
MDPNTLLEEIRELAERAANGDNVAWCERNLRWKFTELDEWLSKGGFLPDKWSNNA